MGAASDTGNITVLFVLDFRSFFAIMPLKGSIRRRKMKKVAVGGLMVALANSYAFGGIVEFSEGAVFDITAPAPVMLNVDVAGAASFNSIDITIGSNDVPITGFTLDDEWTGAFATAFDPAFNVIGAFTFDVWFAATTGSSATVGPNLRAGVITVDPRELGLSEADLGRELQLIVDFDQDFTSRAGSDNFFGIGTVTVVPEPATISLLALAAIGLIRRRKTG